MKNAIKKNRNIIAKGGQRVCNCVRFVTTGTFLCENSRCIVMHVFDFILFVCVGVAFGLHKKASYV